MHQSLFVLDPKQEKSDDSRSDNEADPGTKEKRHANSEQYNSYRLMPLMRKSPLVLIRPDETDMVIFRDFRANSAFHVFIIRS